MYYGYMKLKQDGLGLIGIIVSLAIIVTIVLILQGRLTSDSAQDARDSASEVIDQAKDTVDKANQAGQDAQDAVDGLNELIEN